MIFLKKPINAAKPKQFELVKKNFVRNLTSKSKLFHKLNCWFKTYGNEKTRFGK